ncbi:MAG TPA: TonB-dependent receptor, partial [Chitinophagales bacterium]|nr:TonB-dependent receptor [Chitinophagales bacterium]
HCNLQTTFQKYTTTNETAAWHLPTLQSSLSLHFLPIERLSLGTEIFVYQGMKALLASGNSTTLPAVIDLNLAAKYQIQQHIAVFANGNNLLNRNNGLFYAYPTYKINFLGGILLRF